MHDQINALRNWIDGMAYLCAGVAAVSLSQTALVVTILAGVLSATLAGVRLYDRVKYGRGGND